MKRRGYLRNTQPLVGKNVPTYYQWHKKPVTPYIYLPLLAEKIGRKLNGTVMPGFNKYTELVNGIIQFQLSVRGIKKVAAMSWRGSQGSICVTLIPGLKKKDAIVNLSHVWGAFEGQEEFVKDCVLDAIIF